MGPVLTRAAARVRGKATYKASQQLQDVERVAHRLERMTDDPELQAYRQAVVGGAVPFLPQRAALASAVAVLDQVARVLRHQTGDGEGNG